MSRPANVIVYRGGVALRVAPARQYQAEMLPAAMLFIYQPVNSGIILY